VITVAATTVALPGSAEARWGWRGGGWGWGWGGFGVGLGTGLLLATAARPYYGGYYGYGYPAYSYGYGYPAYSYGYAILLMATDIVALTTAAIIRAIGTPVTPIVGLTMDMPAIRIVDLHRAYYTTLKRPPSGGLFFLNAPDLN
jgi:hypothetical protein